MLYTQESTGYVPALRDQVIAEAKQILRDEFKRGPILSSPRSTTDYLIVHFAGLQHEVFAMVMVDNRNAVIAVEELFRGTIDGCTVHVREVVKSVLMANAAAVIFAHNHPSSINEPSQADELITRRLTEALSLIDVRVLDHLVIGRTGVVSMAERGLM